MRAVYRSAPFFSSYAPAKTFPNAQDALQHARASADAFSIAYAVYECIDGRPKRLATFDPAGPYPKGAIAMLPEDGRFDVSTPEALLALVQRLDGFAPPLDQLLDNGPPLAPTMLPPGPARIDVLAERAAMRRELFHPDDCVGVPRPRSQANARRVTLSPRADVLLRQAHAEGWSIRKTAAIIGSSVEYARVRLKKVRGGPSLRIRRCQRIMESHDGQAALQEALLGRLSLRQAARKLGVHPNSVLDAVRRRRREEAAAAPANAAAALE